MKIMPIYDLRNKAEVALLMKRLDNDTVDSIERLPDSMILLVPEKACPTMTLQDLKEKLSDIDSGDFKTRELKQELANIKSEYDKLAEKLSNSRKEIALKIENELLNELKFLNMEDAKLKVQINKLERMTNEGYDDVEFFISTNVGQDLKPLNKIASGGEVSRVMLALKVIFSKVDNIPILIFDEIDTGIGGETVRKIALKLKEIGDSTQIRL